MKNTAIICFCFLAILIYGTAYKILEMLCDGAKRKRGVLWADSQLSAQTGTIKLHRYYSGFV